MALPLECLNKKPENLLSYVSEKNILIDKCTYISANAYRVRFELASSQILSNEIKPLQIRTISSTVTAFLLAIAALLLRQPLRLKKR